MAHDGCAWRIWHLNAFAFAEREFIDEKTKQEKSPKKKGKQKKNFEEEEKFLPIFRFFFSSRTFFHFCWWWRKFNFCPLLTSTTLRSLSALELFLPKLCAGWTQDGEKSKIIASPVMSSRADNFLSLSLSLFLFSLSAQLSLFHSLFPALLLNKWTKQKKKF